MHPRHSRTAPANLKNPTAGRRCNRANESEPRIRGGIERQLVMKRVKLKAVGDELAALEKAQHHSSDNVPDYQWDPKLRQLHQT